MDRNTLLAFFLIALVLIFTPKYMELVSPQSPDVFQPDKLFNDDKIQKPFSSSTPEQKISKSILPPSPSAIETKEKITTIDTPLYTAVISAIIIGVIIKLKKN